MPNTNPPSPPVSQSYSTCPDDSSTATWPPPIETDVQTTEAHLLDDADDIDRSPASPPPAVNPPLSGTVTIGDSMMENDLTINPPSIATSRSATMSLSPPPGSALASVSSLTTGTPNLESLKQIDASFVDRDETAKTSRLDVGDVSRRHSRHALREGPSSMMTDSDKSVDVNMMDWEDEHSAMSMGIDYPNMRVISTSPSSFLRPGSRFYGTQQSERHVYDVQVEIKHVDLRESFLCGYLRIQGLTEDHPTLTTYFEGEIIGTKYHFITNHESWGANDKVDLNHWSKFNAFRPFHRAARKGPVLIRDIAQRENIFMRWKEHFLVPDHRVRTISGASFEGFYYICFNQVKGEVSGIYFHSKSERFQQLELKHVEDRGCFAAMEFR